MITEVAQERKFYPHYVVWELTNRCNAKCIHCGSESGKCRENELTEEEAMKLAEELGALGCQQVGIIGGEFLMSPYWDKLVRKLKSLGIGVAPLTNGILLTEENIQRMKNAGMCSISLSIDGVAETHDYIRGVPGLFDMAMQNIRKAQAVGFRIGINTALCKMNVMELPALFEQFTEAGIISWQIQGIQLFGRALEFPQLAMDAADYYAAMKMVAKFRQKTTIKISLADNIGHYCSFEPLLRDVPFTGCVAGRYNVGIESNGNIRSCLSIRTDNYIAGNVRERSFTDIWNDPESFKEHRHKPVENLTGFCRTCEYAVICRGGCASMAYSMTGSISECPICLHKYEVENGLSYDEEVDELPVQPIDCAKCMA